MKKILIVALASAGVLTAAPTMAASTWTFSNGGSSTSGTNGNVRTYNSGGVQVEATAWANTANGTSGNNTVLQDAYLGYYQDQGTPYGLGVTNRDKNSGDTGEGSSPEHAMDNENRYDSILLSFDQAVNLTSIKNGWYSGDSDMSVLAYIGASTPPVLAGETYADLIGNGWTHIGTLENPGTSTASTGTGIYSSYWLVGAFNPQWGTPSGVAAGNDYVKLYAATGNVCVGTASGGNCNPPSTGNVPEPGSLALAGLGLLGVIGLRRRK